MNITKNSILNKIVTVRPDDKSWYNNELRHLGQVKDREYNYFVQNGDQESKIRYTTSKNHYHDECRKARAKFNEDKYAKLSESSTTNAKTWWSTVKSLLGKNKGSRIPALFENGIVYTSDKDKANLFNKTYLEATELNSEGKEPPDLPIPNHDLLGEIQITDQDVREVLKNLNTTKSYGPDGISPKMLKEAGPSIIGSLTKLFNCSLATGIFPSLWKKANVTPLYKKCEEYITTNYRPVSLLCILSKIFEKIVFKYMFNYFKSHFKIALEQAGFLPGSSTVTQLLELYNQFCQAVTDGKEIRIVFLDISKAFDRVWHKGLLKKLKSAGITGKLLAWLKNYLLDRQQRVGLNGQFSEWGKIKAGVPQGSVLGPLLFLIFINDLTHIASKCKIRLFADDTCLFIEVDDPLEAATDLNNELSLIEEWADKWLVTFSPPKTKEMVLTKRKVKRNHPPLKLNNQLIISVPNHKHLGITLSSDLSWGDHVDQITTKANRLLNYLTPLKMKLDRKTLEIAYFSFIRPILEYGDIVWDITKENDHTLDPIEQCNANAARLVCGATARCNRAKLYEENKWESMTDRRKNHRLTMLYKMVYQLVPQLLYNLLPTKVEKRTHHNLRSKNDIDTPYARIDAHKYSFLPSTIRTGTCYQRLLKNQSR
jgi:hypothetical protein